MQESIDIINDIVLRTFNSIKVSQCNEQNNVYVYSDDYAVDCLEPKKGKIMFRVRDKYLRNLCMISMEKTGFNLKYSPDFFFQYKEKKKGPEFTSSVTQNKVLDILKLEEEFEEVFNSEFNDRIPMNYENMFNVLLVLLQQYDVYANSLEKDVLQ